MTSAGPLATARTQLHAAGSSAAEFTGPVGWVVDIVATTGPVGVALLLALDNVLPIVPSEVVLPFAGYLAAQGEIGFWVTLAAATLGSTVSAYVLYELGRRLGPDRARAALSRVPLTDERDIGRAGAWFERHGRAAVFTGRFVPLIRSLVSLPAGTEGMGRVEFGVLTAAGSGLWNALWLWIGLTVGRRWEEAGRYSDWFNGALGLVAGVLVVRYVWRRRDRLNS
ncbi:MAG: DedA family protein [Nitriliruptor sp.]